jgi:hypothetical protein
MSNGKKAGLPPLPPDADGNKYRREILWQGDRQMRQSPAVLIGILVQD